MDSSDLHCSVLVDYCIFYGQNWEKGQVRTAVCPRLLETILKCLLPKGPNPSKAENTIEYLLKHGYGRDEVISIN